MRRALVLVFLAACTTATEKTGTTDSATYASVDHVSGGEVYVMDSNYNSNELRASMPHTVWRPAYGCYHLRALPKSNPQPPSGDWCPNNGGHYCGGDGVGGDSSTLYDCQNH